MNIYVVNKPVLCVNKSQIATVFSTLWFVIVHNSLSCVAQLACSIIFVHGVSTIPIFWKVNNTKYFFKFMSVRNFSLLWLSYVFFYATLICSHRDQGVRFIDRADFLIAMMLYLRCVSCKLFSYTCRCPRQLTEACMTYKVVRINILHQIRTWRPGKIYVIYNTTWKIVTLLG